MSKITQKKTLAKKTTATYSDTESPIELSNDTKTIIIILLLLFAYPVGVLCMWIWMKTWPLWLRLAIMTPIILGILASLLVLLLFGNLIEILNRQKAIHDEVQMKIIQEKQMKNMNKNEKFYLSPVPTNGY